VRFDVSEVMERVILRAMNPDPALRYDHVRDLGRELLEVAGVRTQMLWGRSFGRIDLSDPVLELPNSTPPVALLRRTTRPARKAAPRARNAWLGLAAVAAILVSNFWGMRAPQHAPRAAAAQVTQTGEASLLPAAAGSPRAVPSPAPASPLEPPPAVDEPRGASPALAARPAQASAARRGAARSRSAERPRAPRRARAILVAEPRPQPRATLVPDLRPRLVPSDELASEPYPDDVGRMFPPMEGPQDGAKKRAPPPVSTGANESPILD
jgi:hypothetical protein